MDFALSEEQQAIFDMAYAFGQDEIAPHAREWEAAGGTIPKEIWRKLAELGGLAGSMSARSLAALASRAWMRR